LIRKTQKEEIITWRNRPQETQRRTMQETQRRKKSSET